MKTRAFFIFLIPVLLLIPSSLAGKILPQNDVRDQPPRDGISPPPQEAPAPIQDAQEAWGNRIFMGRTSPLPDRPNQPASPRSLRGKEGKSEAEAMGSSGRVILVTRHNVHVRQEPSPTSRVISILRKGREVEKIGESGRWIKVRTPWQKTGFMRGDSLQGRQPQQRPGSTSELRVPGEREFKIFAGRTSPAFANQSPPLHAAEEGKLETQDRVILVTRENVHMRQEPSSAGKVISILRKGREVEKISESGGWVEVISPWEKIGFIRSSSLGKVARQRNRVSAGSMEEDPEIRIFVGRTSPDLNIEPPPPPISPNLSKMEQGARPEKIPERVILVTRENVHMRQEPSQASGIISVLRKGRKVEKIGESGAWVKVKSPWQKSGFIRSNLLKKGTPDGRPVDG